MSEPEQSSPKPAKPYVLAPTWKRLMRLLLLPPLALIIFLAGYGVLNYNGYCFKEGRFLSDQEKYRLVVERKIRYGSPFRPVKPIPPGRNFWSDVRGDKVSHWIVEGHDGPVEPIHYRSADEFFALNPNCCEMRGYIISGSEGPFEPSFWDRAFGDCSGGVVRVTSIARFRDQAGIERELLATSEAMLSNCGMELSTPF